MMWVILLTMAMVSAYPCGQPSLCDCSHPMSREITCQGSNITTFPDFDDVPTASVRSIRLMGTRVSTLPFFLETKWPSLKEIHLMANEDLSCTAIDNLYRDELHIYSRCWPRVPNIPISKTSDHPDIVNPVIGGFMFITGSVLGVIYVWRSQHRPQANTETLSMQVIQA